MKQMADTALSAEGTIPVGRSGGMVPQKIERQYNFTHSSSQEIFPFPKLKGQNTKNIEGQRDFFQFQYLTVLMYTYVCNWKHTPHPNYMPSLYLKPSLSWSKDSQRSVTFQKNLVIFLRYSLLNNLLRHLYYMKSRWLRNQSGRHFLAGGHHLMRTLKERGCPTWDYMYLCM